MQNDKKLAINQRYPFDHIDILLKRRHYGRKYVISQILWVSNLIQMSLSLVVVLPA